MEEARRSRNRRAQGIWLLRVRHWCPGPRGPQGPRRGRGEGRWRISPREAMAPSRPFCPMVVSRFQLRAQVKVDTKTRGFLDQLEAQRAAIPPGAGAAAPAEDSYGEARAEVMAILEKCVRGEMGNPVCLPPSHGPGSPPPRSVLGSREQPAPTATEGDKNAERAAALLSGGLLGEYGNGGPDVGHGADRRMDSDRPGPRPDHKDRGWDRDSRDRDGDRGRDWDRDRDWDQGRGRGRGRDWDRDRDWGRDSGREWDIGKERGPGRDYDRSRDWDRGRFVPARGRDADDGGHHGHSRGREEREQAEYRAQLRRWENREHAAARHRESVVLRREERRRLVDDPEAWQQLSEQARSDLRKRRAAERARDQEDRRLEADEERRVAEEKAKAEQAKAIAEQSAREAEERAAQEAATAAAAREAQEASDAAAADANRAQAMADHAGAVAAHDGQVSDENEEGTDPMDDILALAQEARRREGADAAAPTQAVAPTPPDDGHVAGDGAFRPTAGPIKLGAIGLGPGRRAGGQRSGSGPAKLFTAAVEEEQQRRKRPLLPLNLSDDEGEEAPREAPAAKATLPPAPSDRAGLFAYPMPWDAIISVRGWIPSRAWPSTAHVLFLPTRHPPSATVWHAAKDDSALGPEAYGRLPRR